MDIGRTGPETLCVPVRFGVANNNQLATCRVTDDFVGCLAIPKTDDVLCGRIVDPRYCLRGVECGMLSDDDIGDLQHGVDFGCVFKCRWAGRTAVESTEDAFL